MTHARLSNGVSLACEVHGDPADPVVFIILGITDNITDWPPGLCEPLVAAGHHADEDPIFSLEHGMDMAERIPHARLTVLEGAGHNHPLSLQPVIAGHIVEFAGNSAG